MQRRRILALTTLYSLFPTLGIAEPEPYAESIERIDPFETAGLEPGLANVLRNYYKRAFTDEDTWSEVESIRFDGTIHLPQGTIRFTAFKKKPDYCKVVIYGGHGARVVMAYDGADAWQLPAPRSSESEVGNASESDAAPTAMPEADARNFIRDATTGGHLIYPLINGKQIELLGVTVIDGQRLYELLIALPDGQQIRSFLDTTTFAEARQVTINQVTGEEVVTTYSSFRRIDGILFAFGINKGGQENQQIRLNRVQTNVGVVPWMFSRPSGAFIPDGLGSDGRPESQSSHQEGDPSGASLLMPSEEATSLPSVFRESAPTWTPSLDTEPDIWQTDSIF